MNIKPMLARLESALGQDNLVEQMILLPRSGSPQCLGAESAKSINLIVGYNSSPKSQTALDLTLCIAHQTRLATKAQVTVQVVYVVEDNQSSQCPDVFSSEDACSPFPIYQLPLELAEASVSKSASPVFNQSGSKTIAARPQRTSVDRFEQADHIFWQARCLAEEWQDSFNAHLRFGCIAAELKKVVELEAATLLLLGCNSVNHPIVQKLSYNLPCPVLGIPNCED